ncbi:MAG: phosphoribosylformylglycinamidine synthase subunit PurQ [Bacteroidetes bacterium]|jgi:phosphoribosylformylglycinamidine synthase I|nr:phosphoribosylformylglycinamidine synthase subunit PurQ [Bacteroidota bacterium]
MKFGVVTFPGTNSDQDLIHALGQLLGQQVVPLWHRDADVQGCDWVLLSGGFSYGDYLRSGAIARFSPIMQAVYRHAERGGYVLGICNGFQILTEAGLLPGALLHNRSTTFVCDSVYLKPATLNSPLTRGLQASQVYKIVIAHGEGNYYAPADTLRQLQDQDQILFQYTDAQGQPTDAANPNGSLLNIAGVMNAGRNVFGMMPHPERCADPLLGNADGLAILQSLVQAVPA